MRAPRARSRQTSNTILPDDSLTTESHSSCLSPYHHDFAARIQSNNPGHSQCNTQQSGLVPCFYSPNGPRATYSHIPRSINSTGIQSSAHGSTGCEGAGCRSELGPEVGEAAQANLSHHAGSSHHAQPDLR
ncbi:Hypothetical predicted protein [Pelobates cultripes]|uniref:Uncharacterized protein n=1 Tax=Pelobates cultripes TaxID=61616 RepID=A0AAD1R3X2_PELCU|nr:Hypothetical predicted protein [Pelobates cultripes]